MKRILSLFLTAIMTFSLMLPTEAFAEENKELEKAISTVKSVLNMTETYDTFSYNMFKENNKTAFSLSWNDSKNKLGSVNVSVDSEGRITSYYSYKSYNSTNDTSKIPKVTKSDALKTANEFILKANKSLTGRIQYKDENAPLNISDNNYHFYFIRIENGVLFPHNSVNVSVNNRTGEVENFSVNWTDDLLFPTPSGLITLEKAQQLYTQKLGLKIVYKLSYNEETQAPYLVYTNVFSDRSIDAVTGDVIYGNTYYYLENEKSAKMAGKGEAAQDARSNVVLTPEEKKAVENSSKLVSQSNAESTARRVLSLDSSYTLESINLYSNGRTKADYVWNIYFIKEEKKDGKTYQYSASITLDAVTGDVLNFYRSLPYDSDSGPRYNKDQALSIANSFIRTMQPYKAGEAEYTTWQEPMVKPVYDGDQPRQYSFTYTRKSNGIYFMNNGFNLTVDAVSGTVTNYSFSWYNGQLPPSDKIINSAEAHKKLYEDIGLRLQYMADYSNKMDSRKILPPNERQIKPDIKLVYAINPGKPTNIDAPSGNLLDYSGKPYEERAIAKYSDIGGNFAEKQINILAQYGISLPGSEFIPGKSIAQKEFLYLLAKSINSYAELNLNDDKISEDKLYEYFINLGIIKEPEKSPSSDVTRQDAAKYIVRILKYDKIADIKGIYKLSFKDSSNINEDLYGYVAIAYGLSILRDDGGYFKPDSSLTRAQTAMLIYNFLSIN